MLLSRLAIVLGIVAITASAQVASRQWPQENKLPITPDSLCAGVSSMLQVTKQDIRDESAILCNGKTSTDLMKKLVTTPFAGVGDPVLEVLSTDEEDMNLRIRVAYAIRVPRQPSSALLGEEKHVSTKFSNNSIVELSSVWLDPQNNDGDSDTRFLIQQFLQVDDRGGVDFKDYSNHDLMFYQLFRNNVDFYAAARTLAAVQPEVPITEKNQFRRSVIFRVFMRDPADEKSTISVTILHFLMNARRRHEEMAENFLNFIASDLRVLYQEQSTPTPTPTP